MQRSCRLIIMPVAGLQSKNSAAEGIAAAPGNQARVCCRLDSLLRLLAGVSEPFPEFLTSLLFLPLMNGRESLPIFKVKVRVLAPVPGVKLDTFLVL